MESVTLVIDESGAKGYSDNHEAEAGEFGVLAGFIIPNDILNRVTYDLNELLSDYASDNKKNHITDFKPNTQTAIRDKIYKYFKAHEVF